MDLTPADLVGFVGVALVVGTYFLSQIGRMDVTRLLYPMLNGVGAALIIFSLLFAFSAAAFVVEVFWLAISLVGVARIFLKKNNQL
jgi:hypothetical protein